MNILIVEDNIPIAQAIKSIFLKDDSSHIVQISHSFEEGFHKIHSSIFDIILLDIHLGDKKNSGLDLCEIIRKNDLQIPIIMITGYNSIDFLEQAFKIGANDYIHKPFHPKELLVRIKRWQEMFPKYVEKKDLQYEDLQLCINSHKISYKRKPLRMGKKTKQLLKIFLEYPEKVLSPYYIQERLWGDDLSQGKNRNLRSNIQALRTSLGNTHWIQTVRGEGYILQKENH